MISLICFVPNQSRCHWGPRLSSHLYLLILFLFLYFFHFPPNSRLDWLRLNQIFFNLYRKIYSKLVKKNLIFKNIIFSNLWIELNFLQLFEAYPNIFSACDTCLSNSFLNHFKCKSVRLFLSFYLKVGLKIIIMT